MAEIRKIKIGNTEYDLEAASLTGVTASATELNYVDGVTSNIQTQLNNKSQVQIVTWGADD